MLPTTADGTPLCFLDEHRREPHAWVKLWKHHAAQPEADEINRVAAELGEPWLDRYGGKISSEWFFPKALQILREAPAIVPGRGPAHRGRRLGHLAAHRGRDPEQLHGRLQGALVGGGRLPRSGLLRRPRSRVPRRGRREDVADDRPSRRGRRRPDRAGGRLDGPPAGYRRSRSRTSTPTSPSRPPSVTAARLARRDHGHEHLPPRPVDSAPRGARHVRRRPRRRRARPVRVRGRPGVGRRPVRLVRRARRAARRTTRRPAPAA